MKYFGNTPEILGLYSRRSIHCLALLCLNLIMKKQKIACVLYAVTVVYGYKLEVMMTLL